MRFNHRSPSHWIAVAIVVVLGLFTVNHALGQSSNAAAAFEGRPALAGAQGGLGAQGGVPQGGLGVQGNEASQRQLNPRKPAEPGAVPDVPAKPEVVPGKARSEVTLVPRKDGVAKEQRSPARTAKRAAKRTIERSRTGVGGIDSSVGGSR